MQQNEESLGQRLERLRKERKLSAKEVARLIDVAESTYREWEYGRGLRLPPWQRISHVLAVSVTELVTGVKPDLQQHLKDLESAEENLRQIRLKLGSLI